MSWFGAFRNYYGFTWYSDYRTSVTIDIPTAAVLYFCVLVCVATLFSTLGIRGRERWSTTLRALYAVGLTTVILVCLVGHNWQEGTTQIRNAQYLYRTDYFFQGTVGLRVALHGVNVTLDGYYRGPNGQGHVYYAEDLKWADYGKEQEMISHYLDRGLPHPILTVMDFLSVDAGGLRWGRNFHSAGYFSGALMWTSLSFWIIANVLLLSVVSYGAFMFALTGVAMVLSCIVYHVCQPPQLLRIHFGDAVLTTHYGWCFWLTLAAGIMTTILGTLLFVFDHMFHEKLSEFFNLENLDEDDLPELTPASSMIKDKDNSLNSAPMLFNRGGSTFQQGQRRSSVQWPVQRRGSIFLEPERRPSDTATGVRRGSGMFPSHGFGVGGLGVHNKAFEKERSKSNPLFGTTATDIKEENEDAERSADVRIEMGGDEMSKYGNKKPSLATMREHRENHMNEQQQKQTAYFTESINTDDTTTPSAIVVHCPSDEDVMDSDDAGKTTSDKTVVFSVGFGMTGDPDLREATFGKKGCPHDCSDDSAIASACNSPFDSEKTSTCGDTDEYKM
ncbi:hypothetical protein BaRGS_00016057 [Batillaria attramentaria]|uniref:Dual oxidase maturation factor 1 n=1 Tax=Batillaria attramentaria TaxID=370345 RepID=A0ABD0KZY5_9CAEN